MPAPAFSKGVIMARSERGMATAEYTVGTVGAVFIALVLYRLGLLDHDNPWVESIKEVLQRALVWRKLGDVIPGLGSKIL